MTLVLFPYVFTLPAILSFLTLWQGCLIMPDFIRRFGEFDEGEGDYVLSSSRQSIITSLLSAG
jgi:hypothetical protein